MNFQLTKEQQMVREMVRDFAKNEIAPKAHEVDQSAVFP
ncbi:acyl-CoA dehydrogenase family protein, partial [Bacillus velezensis]